MTIVSNYNIIVGPGERARIGDHGVQDWDKTFSTNDAYLSGNAYFLVEFKGLTQQDPAPVVLNGTRVGRLAPYSNHRHYHTQIVDFPAGHLEDQSDNTVEISAVPHLASEGPGHFDNFSIENMVCHFHKDI